MIKSKRNQLRGNEDKQNSYQDLIRLLDILGLTNNYDSSSCNSVCMTLDSCHGRMPIWKNYKRGLYLFFDSSDSSMKPSSMRMVRVGTHSVKSGGSKSTLWGRLKQHRGNERDEGGNHRGSIFRLLVGDALIEKGGLRNRFPQWGMKGNATSEIKRSELALEQRVSGYIRRLPFLVIKVDPPENGPEHRSFLEHNLIALLSSVNRCDEPNWLGRYSTRPNVRNSGLWNNNHINEQYDPAFFYLLEHYVRDMQSIGV